eukprot:310905_1
MTESNGQRSQRSSTSQMYSRGSNQFDIYNKNEQIQINTIQASPNNSYSTQKQSSHSTYTDASSAGVDSGYQTIEKRIQRCGWYIWIVLCLCCPIFCPFVLIWYLTTSCIRPRCYMIFTMLLSIIWIWIDEITDIVFIYFLTQYNIHFMKYLYIGCIIFNHFFNFILSLIIRNNWCDDKSVQKQYQYMYHKTIPKWIKYLCLLFIGILNVSIFNIVCKTYYLLKNKNNVGTIYIDQRFPCSRTPTHSIGNNKISNENNDKLSKNEKLQKWYNKLYDMEALSIKEMFNTMLEKEAQIYPLLILCQFFETIPKMIIFSIMTQSTHITYDISKEHHPLILIKLVMVVVSFCAQIKACFISCANAEFIEQFNDE